MINLDQWRALENLLTAVSNNELNSFDLQFYNQKYNIVFSNYDSEDIGTQRYFSPGACSERTNQEK